MADLIGSGTDSSWSLLRRLLAENGRAFLPRYLLAFALMAVVALTTAGSAWIMENVIDDVVVAGAEDKVAFIAAMVALLFLVKGLASYGQNIVLARIGNAIVASIQRRIFRHVLSQDMAFFQRSQASNLVTRMSHNAAAARHALNLFVTSMGRDLLTLIALIVVMVVKEPVMSLIALLVAPPAVIGVSMLVNRMKKHAQAEFTYITHIIAAMQETSLGVRIIKAFNLEDQMRLRMDDAIANAEGRANKIAALNARTGPIMETLGGLAIAGVIVYAGWRAGANPDATAGSLVAFITALLLAYEPAKRLARLSVQLRQHLVGVDLFYDLLDTEPALRDAEGATELTVSKGRVTLDNVSFAYPDSPALKGVTLEAPAGAVTALVGPSGAGKSTVFHLIERFADPDEGTVSIDGRNLRDATIRSVRAQISLVSQDTFLFDDSVRENIACGRLGASEDDIIEAAKNANAHEFIIAMRGGYDAPVGEGGGNLSGGQRQRIAIARAMLRNAPILLLDEPTSALDAESEKKVQEALDRLMRGRTTIVIAHRLSTISRSDLIHVLDEGKLVQSGSHDALMRDRGLYAHLHALQFREGAA